MQLEESLRRACCVLALLLAIATGVMGFHARFSTRVKLPPGMKSAGVALELVRTNQDFWDLTADPSDRRGVMVELTTKGRKLIEAAAATRFAEAEASLPPLTASELAQLAGLLRKWLATVPDRGGIS